MTRRSAIFLVLLSAAGFGSMALFAKTAYGAGVGTNMLLAWRFLIAVAVLAPVVFRQRIALPRGRTLAGFVLMGALYTAQAQSFFTALRHASSGLVALLLYAYPVLVALLAALLGWERIDRRTAGLLAMAVAGLGITLGGHLEGDATGIFFGLLAPAIYAAYILVGGRLMPRAHPLAATLVVLTAAGVFNTLLALGSGEPMPQGATAWVSIAAIAVFSTALAIGGFLAGIRHVGAAQASILSTFEPVVTLVLGVVVLHETVSASQLAGGATVLVAVILLARRPQPRAPRGAAAAAGQ